MGLLVWVWVWVGVWVWVWVWVWEWLLLWECERSVEKGVWSEERGEREGGRGIIPATKLCH